MVAQLDAEVIRARPARVVPRLLSYALFEGRPATTKGRWINAAVAANLAIGERLVRRCEIDRPIVIVGLGRSGTTVLGQLFGVHSDVGFLNEPKAMWHRIIPDEDLIGSYGPEPVRLRLGAADASPAVRERAQRLYAWYQLTTRSGRVVDKYPELVYRPDFVRALFPDVQVVAITRRPWDVVTSIESWGRTKGTADADWWGIADRKWRVLWEQELSTDPRWGDVAAAIESVQDAPLVRAAAEWLVGTDAVLRLDASIPAEQLHVVRYEDLVADARAFMGDLLQRCGLRVEAPVLELAARRVTRTRPPSPQPGGLPAPLVDAIDSLAAELESR